MNTLDVTFGEDGRYNVSQDDTGHSHAFESGQPRDIVGNNMVLGFAYDLNAAREALGKLSQSIWGGPENQPNVYDDYDTMCYTSQDCEKICSPQKFSMGGSIFRDGESPISLFVQDSESKYTVVVTKRGNAHAYRHSVKWLEITGDDMVIALASEVRSTRTLLSKLALETFGPDVANSRAVPDIYDDKENLDSLKEQVQKALPTLEFGETLAPSPGR